MHILDYYNSLINHIFIYDLKVKTIHCMLNRQCLYVNVLLYVILTFVGSHFQFIQIFGNLIDFLRRHGFKSIHRYIKDNLNTAIRVIIYCIV